MKLENLHDGTRVTNLTNGESVVVEGRFAGVLSDQQYAKMMRIKREQKARRLLKDDEQSATMAAQPGRVSASGVTAISTQCSGTYSVNGATGGWSSPLCYLNNSTAVSLSGSAISSINKSLSVTLYRNIDFWPDQSYGTKTFTATSQGAVLSGSWSSVQAGAYYYLDFSTAYNGISVYGNFAMIQ
ncbi:hypothetical protein [Pseudoduganella ginsengisoli]|uniref:Uncharacterized protein n=1 Tax=Pseudoduganella ginsengisoli TaxID=1462440 RepID=A0A6L6Q0U9_9BURK|nr:hypothetical protein [Pseudoduganella ginsengisoli]